MTLGFNPGEDMVADYVAGIVGQLGGSTFQVREVTAFTKILQSFEKNGWSTKERSINNKRPDVNQKSFTMKRRLLVK